MLNTEWHPSAWLISKSDGQRRNVTPEIFLPGSLPYWYKLQDYKYENKQSWNNEFTLLDGEFFELKPGRNVVTCSGVQQGRIHITPNWWTV